MSVNTQYLHFSTQGNTDIIEITSDVQEALSKAKLKAGTVTVSVVGSTAGVTTCEYEPGLEKDLKDFFQKIIPQSEYHHDQAWGDGNGHAHLRASLLGPSLTIPFVKGKLILGTWQQIIFLDFDNRKRQREVVLQFIGE